MRGTLVTLALVLVVTTPLVGGVVAGSGPVAAGGGPGDATHGNHVALDPQVTSDGTVVVETVSALTPTFVVLRADDGGRPGAPIGHAYVGQTGSDAFQTVVPVSVEQSAWEAWSGNRTVWAVLHGDDNGNGEFDDGTDRSLAGLNPAASTRVTVRRGDSGDARVLAAAFDPLALTDDSVTLRRVELPSAGHVVVTPTDGNGTVGTRSLSAGTHRNVTVELDESFVASGRSRFRVRAVAYRDDGDGVFGPGDRPITAGGEPVGTYLTVQKGNESDEPLINTPTGTTVSTVETATQSDGGATSAGTDTAGTGPTTGRSNGRAATAGATETASGSGHGFGAALAIVALLVAVTAVPGTGRR